MPLSGPHPITSWLQRAGRPAFVVYVTTASFATYFCMYAFRKPFAAGIFEGAITLPGAGVLGLKTLFVVAQVLGYAASKFLGIKVVSEMLPGRRARAILGLVLCAELALLVFAVVPPPWSAVGLFLNGLALGMIWGLVFGFVEGRRVSDLLGAGLCASFIVASGFVKTVGKIVIGWGVGEYWMPFVTGALFFGPFGGFVWLLAKVPAPDEEDEQARVGRAPMDGRARVHFLVSYAPGLSMLVAAYVVLTAYRDFRDNFAREIWDALGYADQPSILTTAEFPVAFGSLLAVALIVTVRDNRRALLAVHLLMLLGSAVLIGATTIAYVSGVLEPAAWMIAVGLGLYLGYVPFNCVLFDRMIAALGSVATAGFLIYVADAAGYAGSVALLLYKNLGTPALSWLEFFTGFSYATAAVTSLLYLVSAFYFWRTRGPRSMLDGTRSV